MTTLTDGLRCTTEEGPWRIDADLPDRLGGDATAPTPSVLLRAALGSVHGDDLPAARRHARRRR